MYSNCVALVKIHLEKKTVKTQLDLISCLKPLKPFTSKSGYLARTFRAMSTAMIRAMYSLLDKKVGFILNKNILWVSFIDRLAWFKAEKTYIIWSMTDKECFVPTSCTLWWQKCGKDLKKMILKWRVMTIIHRFNGIYYLFINTAQCVKWLIVPHWRWFICCPP